MSPKKQLLRLCRFFLSIYFGYVRKINAVSQTHGVNFILNEKLHPLERIVWVIIVCFAFTGSLMIANIQVTRFIANPSVISLERDYHDWNGTMPAVTFCYVDRLSPEAVEIYIEEKWNITASDDEYPYFSSFIESVVNISILNLGVFDEFAFDDRLRDASFLEITQFVVPIFEQYISNFDRSILLEALPIITEMGLCYSVNSPLTQIFSVTKKKPYEEEKIHVQKPLSCKFSQNQCFMKIDVYGIQLSSVFVHSPFEVPLADTTSFAMDRTDEITATYKILETTADDSFRELSHMQRKCLFYDEQIRAIPSYTTNLCTMECRAVEAMSACGCKPFFYPFIAGPDCGIDGIFCLNRISWLERIKGKCECPKPCLDLLYLKNTFKVENWDVGDDGIPFAQKSTFRLEILPPKMRHRREVLFTFEDLLVSLGAATSLFIGLCFYDMLRGVMAHIDFVIDFYRWCRARLS